MCSLDRELRRVVEILDPGLLLDRIGGTRISRRDASLVTDRAPDHLRILKDHPLRCRGPGSRRLMSGIQFMV